MKTLFKKIIPKSKHNLASYVFNEIKSIHIDKPTKKFIKHNQEVWNDYFRIENKAEILFEMTGMHTSIVAYSYLANVLAKKHNAKIKVYSFGENNRISSLHRKIYKSFNAKIFSYFLNQQQLCELEGLFNEVYTKLNTKKDVINLFVSGLWIGDLLYDAHMKEHSVPTVVIKDQRFKESLNKALYQYIYWRDYFDNHNVKAINVTHSTYLTGIPMRIAVSRDIPAYECHIGGCSYLTKERLWGWTGYYDYPKQFRELPEVEQRKGLKEARERIECRFAGKVGVDMTYSTRSAFTEKKVGRVLSKSNKIKVFIAAHCFFDNPNGLGLNLFPDFYEWLTFLGNISDKTDYDWYIKTHPDFLPGNILIIDEFRKKYHKFTLLPAETSHHQIIEEGIDYALTVYGTIGFEYAALGCTVITASLCNPFIAYNFNIHPKSIDEYENILMHLPEQKLRIDTNEVYEYYFMRYIENNVEDWLFDNYADFVNEIGGYTKQFTSVSYERYLNDFSGQKHERILYSLTNFIDSKDYCLQKKHMKFIAREVSC
jgi:hypothetical protein